MLEILLTVLVYLQECERTKQQQKSSPDMVINIHIKG